MKTRNHEYGTVYKLLDLILVLKQHEFAKDIHGRWVTLEDEEDDV